VNTTTVLFGATFALLLAAVVLSFNNMTQGVKNAPNEEIARIQSQIDQLRIEQDRLEIERQRTLLRSNPTPEVPTFSDTEALKQQLAAAEAERAKLAAEKADADRKAETYQDENSYLKQHEIEKQDDEHRRARIIKHAILIGTINEYINNPELGTIVTIDIAMPDLIEVGKILAIRRKTGILGTIKITEVTAEGAIGSPMPGFGTVPPVPGDELITPPIY